jgi:hypothetical protein
MGFFRDVGSQLGVCDEVGRDEREKREKDYAKSVTGHDRGCDCHWCKCARLGWDRRS